MPILETGNKTAGYTLLEVVAVLTLIGLIMALTYPRINYALEQAEVGFMGRLIRSDFKELRDESISDPGAEIAVTFTISGYSFTIGEHYINRVFGYHFAFELPESISADSQTAAAGKAIPENRDASPEPVIADGDHTVGAADLLQMESGQRSTANNENPGSQSEKEPAHYIVKMNNGELSGEELQLRWQTSHFTGSLLCQKDGMVGWKYEKR
jgi:prepilin-type N-terminal cleavage/methylation domain